MFESLALVILLFLSAYFFLQTQHFSSKSDNESIILIVVISSFLLFRNNFVFANVGERQQKKIVYLASLDWPPYNGKGLIDGGANTLVAKMAFAAMGYELVVDFYPWQRAVEFAKMDSKYSGYFPEYYSKEIETDFIFSNAMGEGPLGFAERKDNKITWNSLSDLRPYTIGIVQGYVNTEKFDEMVKAKILKVDPVLDDLANLKKISLKRIPLAVIDKYVFNYLVNENLSTSSEFSKLQFNAKILENKKIFICFSRSKRESKGWVNIFNEGLKKINYQKIMEDYFKKIHFPQ
ncbi:MAG: transporter substrate-binding domain-containing protein [Oligoflexia bacterium]|nr:transporter substrate-binding domain-containing protein [Oligoflexia bacterium]